MVTKLLSAASAADREEAGRLLRGGGLVAFPTETVYGLGALGLEDAAVARIFEAKGRPACDPLILHVSGVVDLQRLCRPDDRALLLARRFWPGPLTLVLPALPEVPLRVRAGLPSVAVRSPQHPAARELIRLARQPLAAPSANLFGHVSPTTARHVLDDLEGRIDAVLDAGPTSVGVESTVLSLAGDHPVLLRPGGISARDLSAALGEEVRSAGASSEGPQLSPGMMARHYSPRARLLLIDEAEDHEARRRLRAAAGEGAALLLLEEDAGELTDLPVRRILLGSRSDPAAVAAHLYAALRELDDTGVSTIAVRLMPVEEGLAAAINDRLRRAAGSPPREHDPLR